MAGELFGTPNGFIAYDQDQQIQAQARDTNAKAAATEFATKQKQQMMKIFQGEQQVQQGGQAVDKMEEMSNRLMQAGMVEEGGKMATQASEIRLRTASAARQVETQKVQKMVEMEKTLEGVAAALGTVDTSSPDAPLQYERAKMMWMNQHPEQPLPPGLSTYNKQGIEMLQKGTKNGLAMLRDKRMQMQFELNQDKAAASEQDKADTRTFREKELASREQGRKFLVDNANERARLSREATDRRTKSTGKTPAVGMPSKELLTLTSDMIGHNYPGMSKYDSDQASFNVASDAKSLMASNRGLTPAEALQQAYDKADANGDFKQEAGKKIFGYEYSKGGSSYKRMSSPKPLPKDLSPGNLKVGQVYSSPQGEYRWDGKNFVKTPAKKSSPASNDGGGDNSSGSNDEEQ